MFSRSIARLGSLGIACLVAFGAYAEDIEEIRKAAEWGAVDAQFDLGQMYFLGYGVPKDHQKAFKWYGMAAEQGDAKAQNILGMMYGNGIGVPKDLQKARKWMRRSAEQGSAKAQYNLGQTYWDSKDYGEALKWYLLAAKQRDADAMFNVGVMYYNGEGVLRNLIQSYMWFRLAGARGQGALKGLPKLMTPSQIASAEELAKDWELRNPPPPR